jgi:hypothetical protein
MTCSRLEVRKNFFFEKKKQKTFFNLGHGLCPRQRPCPASKEFLVTGQVERESMYGDLETIIRKAIPKRQPGARKGGRDLVQPAIQRALKEAGYVVDYEDSCCFLRAGMPVWQLYSSGAHIVDATAGRRAIDLVVYGPNNRSPVALVEVESDLANMGSKAGYAVASIAYDARGQPFDSYKSVERMAAAVQFWAMQQASGRYPTSAEGVGRLQAIRSDSPADHNPTGISLLLVCEVANQKHVELLKPRLESLGMVQPLVGILPAR